MVDSEAQTNMNKYIKYKLSLKINLHLSSGKETKGVASDELIDKLLRDFHGYGKYEIIWDLTKSIPIALNRLSDSYEVHNTGSQYVFFPSQFIEFDISEYRNRLLIELLQK